MSFIEIKLIAPIEQLELLETILLSKGAVSVTLKNNSSDDILEPSVGEQPLWDSAQISGLFEKKNFSEQLYESLKTDLQPFRCKLQIQELIDQDWERKCLENYSPIYFGGNLWVCPSWQEPPDESAVNLILDPGLAFGTGTHPTTALCLEWLAKTKLKNFTLIDYGCGSGILAIAAILLGAEKAICIDNDPQAILSTKENIKKNNLDEDKFYCFSPKQFDEFIQNNTIEVNLLMANILANPLIELAPKFKNILSEKGSLILSGIICDQAEKVIAAYSDNINFLEPNLRDEWVMIFGRRA